MIHNLGDDVFGPTLAGLHRGENHFGIRIMAVRAGRCRNGEAGRQVLQAVIAVPGSRHRDLANVPGETARTAQQLPADDGTSSDSARYRQEKKIAPLASAKAILAPGCRLGIVQCKDRAREEIR